MGVWLSGVLVACGDDGGSTGESGGIDPDDGGASTTGAPLEPAPRVVTEADVAAACGMAGATRVELHATRIGCENPPPAPCTLPDPPRAEIGDGVDCPSTSSPVTMRVELVSTGRYNVELVTFAGETELSRVCQGIDSSELLVTEEQIAADATIEVVALSDHAC